MKKLIFIFTIGIFSQIQDIHAQGLQTGECGIMFTYDATGSLTKREFICNNTGSVMYRTGKVAMENAVTETAVKDLKEEVIKINAIMPNPTTGRFTVTLSQPLKNANILLLNTNGSVIERKKESGSTLSFDVSKHASGTYYVRIENEGGSSITFKVIKQ